MFFAGLFMGYIETFMYRYIYNLGATSTVIALTVVVAAPLEIILNLFSQNISKIIRHSTTISLCLMFYPLRLFSKSCDFLFGLSF